jgi:hypothetical protein
MGIIFIKSFRERQRVSKFLKNTMGVMGTMGTNGGRTEGKTTRDANNGHG